LALKEKHNKKLTTEYKMQNMLEFVLQARLKIN